MRLVYVSLIIRLLAMLVYPAVALAADNAEINTVQNTNTLIKIENGVVSKVNEEDHTLTEILSNSLLKLDSFDTPAVDIYADTNKKRIAIFNKRLEAYNPPKGKINILVTGYSSTVDQCDGDPFTTASGTRVHKGTMACPPQYPFGTKIKIEGMGSYVCEDRGGAIKGNHFDMWFTSRGEALAWGKRTVAAEIVK